MSAIRTVANDVLDLSRTAVIAQRYKRSATLEVTPKTAERIATFHGLLPPNRRIYIAHLPGVSITDMVSTAHRIRDDGFVPMPHIPARLIPSEQVFGEWLKRYADVGVTEALVVAGGQGNAEGPFESSMDLLQTGSFQIHGFKRLHFAAHPEGNRDISARGEPHVFNEALRVKQEFADSSDIDVALVTQFVFDSVVLLDWLRDLRTQIDLPVFVGIPGPTKLPALLKYAISCGVGASLHILQRHAASLTRLIKPYTADALIHSVSSEPHLEALGVEGFHVFPFGGIAAGADWIRMSE